MGDILQAKDMFCIAPLYLRGFACSNDGAAIYIVHISQGSRAETGELRERKVLSRTLSELVASLHWRPLADINQSVTCTELIIWKYCLFTVLCSGMDNNGCYPPSTYLLTAAGWRGWHRGLRSWCYACGPLKRPIPWSEWLDSANANAWNFSAIKAAKSMWQCKTWSF